MLPSLIFDIKTHSFPGATLPIKSTGTSIPDIGSHNCQGLQEELRDSVLERWWKSIKDGVSDLSQVKMRRLLGRVTHGAVSRDRVALGYSKLAHSRSQLMYGKQDGVSFPGFSDDWLI